MRFRFIRSYEKIAHLIDGPYNDPEKDSAYNEEAYEKEYESVRAVLKKVVQSYCESHDYEQESVDVGHRTGPTRGIGLVVEEAASGNIVELIESIKDLLSSLKVDYCVPINLVLDEEGDFKDLNIAITKEEEVLVRAEKRKWFKEIGIQC